jgi:hypothetical protein
MCACVCVCVCVCVRVEAGVKKVKSPAYSSLVVCLCVFAYVRVCNGMCTCLVHFSSDACSAFAKLSFGEFVHQFVCLVSMRLVGLCVQGR